MCRDKCGWDDALPEELQPRWERWLRELLNLTEINISRSFIPDDFGAVRHCEIHHFADASTTGYGQCSYLRLKNDDGRVHCCFLIGKSRVAPLKPTTVPRLELTAAVVSVKMSNILKEELTYDVSQEHFWTDSKRVLGYICNEERRFNVFVANRIQLIKEYTSNKQWHYVKSEDNPADHASRGLYTRELVSSTWFEGPFFLWNRDLLFEEEENYEMDPQDPEVKQTTVHTASVSVQPNVRESETAEVFKLERCGGCSCEDRAS